MTRGRQVVIVAGFDKAQAEAALRVLQQPASRRKGYAETLRRLLPTVKPHERILCTPKTPGGLIEATPIALPRRSAQLLADALLMGNEPGVEELKRDLEQIAAGLATPGQIMRPFLRTEFAAPRGQR